MAIIGYYMLQSAIQEWMDREDLKSDKLEDMISLAEARFNRELKMVDTDATLFCAKNSPKVDISLLDILEPRALFLIEKNSNKEVKLTMRVDGDFPYSTTPGYPSFWAIDGDAINFDCPLIDTCLLRFRYGGKFALSDSVLTNKLLQDHPDIYLAGAIVWGGLFVEDDAKIAKWSQMLDTFMMEAKRTIAQSRRGTLISDLPVLGNSYRW